MGRCPPDPLSRGSHPAHWGTPQRNGPYRPICPGQSDDPTIQDRLLRHVWSHANHPRSRDKPRSHSMRRRSTSPKSRKRMSRSTAHRLAPMKRHHEVMPFADTSAAMRCVDRRYFRLGSSPDCRLSASRCECLRQIVDDVSDVFDADRDADVLGFDAGFFLLFG